ncbi:EVE domain-containing protein [Puniceicoccaceae bacterium K14]|nr:EVE domain-containing protein [Puniceicoccaceae bacterium K14]
MAKKYWLIKSEPDVFSLDHLKNCPDQTEHWDGIRNYQARNLMRDEMQEGDEAIFYHSNAGKETGAVGLSRVVSESAYPDYTSWDPKSKYYDEKSSEENPRWVMVDFKWRAEFPKLVSLQDMKKADNLDGMLVIKQGQRLSIQPVEKKHFVEVCKMGGLKASEIKALGL